MARSAAGVIIGVPSLSAFFSSAAPQGRSENSKSVIPAPHATH